MIHRLHHGFGFLIALGVLGVILLFGQKAAPWIQASSLNQGKVINEYAEYVGTPSDRTRLESTRDDFANFFQSYESERIDLLERTQQASRQARSSAQELEEIYQILHFKGVDPSWEKILNYTGKVCLNQRTNIPCD